MYKTLIIVVLILSALYIYSLSKSNLLHHHTIQKVSDTCQDIGSSSNPYKQQENLLKNRACVPQPITKEFAIDSVENVQVDNNDYVRVIGYLVKYKWEGPESCNCYSHDPQDFDEHLYLASDSEEHKLSNTFICEITRKASRELRQLRMHELIGKKVAVEGYVFLDPDHINSKWRKSSIEVHPVVDITIID